MVHDHSVHIIIIIGTAFQQRALIGITMETRFMTSSKTNSTYYNNMYSMKQSIYTPQILKLKYCGDFVLFDYCNLLLSTRWRVNSFMTLYNFSIELLLRCVLCFPSACLHAISRGLRLEPNYPRGIII